VSWRSFSDSPLWHSFIHGLAHTVGIISEVSSYGGGSVHEMLAWVEKDLASVDRAASPWVFALFINSFMINPPILSVQVLDKFSEQYVVWRRREATSG